LIYNEDGATSSIVIDAIAVESQDQLKTEIHRLSTTNELSLEEKRILQKKTKKLQSVLGSINTQSAMEYIKASQSSYFNVIDSSEDSTSPIQITDSDVEYDLLHLEQEIQTYLQEPKDARDTKKKRLDKLTAILGHRILPNDLTVVADVRVSLVPHSEFGRPLPAPRVLSDDERKSLKKRLAKVEKLLGALPPPQALLRVDSPVASSSSANPPTSNMKSGILTSESFAQHLHMQINSFKEIIENTDDMLQLLETIARIGQDTTSENSSSNADIEKEDNYEDEATSRTPSSLKEQRMKKLSKLRKFFGNDMKVEDVLECQVLNEFENTITAVSYLVENQNEKDKSNVAYLETLKKDLEELRGAVRRKSSQLSNISI
jgi:hypothetical protein